MKRTRRAIHALGFVLLIATSMSACDSADPASSFQDPGSEKSALQKTLSPLPSHPDETPAAASTTANIGVTIHLPTPRWRFSHLGVPDNRNVAARSFDVSEFSRTLENTELGMDVDTSGMHLPAGRVLIAFYQNGVKIGDSEQNDANGGGVRAHFDFVTPKLSKEERPHGFSEVGYDVLVVAGKDGSMKQHRRFDVVIYDESVPALVTPADRVCHVYLKPAQISGCYQNHTRSTQEIVYNDQFTEEHSVSVDYSGGLQLPISIVTFSLGYDKTHESSTSTSHGSEIHFTNCIECSSVIYRQDVLTIQPGNVYWVRADGTLEWAGGTVVKSRVSSYEFESTPSESQDYSCNIPSKMQSGVEPGCESYAKDLAI